MLRCEQNIVDQAARVGASVQFVMDAIVVDCRPGFLWNASGTDTLHQIRRGHDYIKACATVCDRIAYGIRPCTPEERNAIEHERGEPWDVLIEIAYANFKPLIPDDYAPHWESNRFIECGACRDKPGTPPLCNWCLFVRERPPVTLITVPTGTLTLLPGVPAHDQKT